MFTTHRTNIARALVVTSALLGGLLLGGCSDDSSSKSDNAQPAGASAEPTQPTDPFEQALAFSQCMRDNGVPNFPDPEQQGGGGLTLSPGDIDPNSSAFASAQEACRDKLPQGQLGGSGDAAAPDSAKVAAWAKCIRENGLPKFPDPEINGNSMSIDFGGAGIDPGSEDWQKARLACQDKWPGGALTATGDGQ